MVDRSGRHHLEVSNPLSPLPSDNKIKDAPTRSCNPKPDPLKEIPRILLRPDLSVQSRLASPQIGFRRLDELGLLVELPEEEEAEVDWDDDVSARRRKISGWVYERFARGFPELTYAVTKSWIDQLDSPVMASWVKTFQPLNTTMMMKKTSAA